MDKKKVCNYGPWALLALRLVVVFIFLWHGIPKAFNWGMAMEKFVGMGFYGFLGPIVGIAEVIAAVLLLVGFWTKWASYALAIIIAVALVGVQLPNGMSAGLERDLLILVSTFVLALVGPGMFTLEKS